jgi:decaprenyl-phosphate phosphoribosyltransferase
LGFGKRLHELLQGGRAIEQRKVLRQYDDRTLTALLYVTGTATVVTYVFYSLDPTTRAQFHTDYLVLTSLMPAFGVLRFMHLVRHARESESPTEAMLRDPIFVLNLGAWVVAVVAVIYAAHA